MIRKIPVGKNKFAVEITCDKCGKPITVSNKYGMFCEDLCDLEESKKAKKTVDKLLKDLIGLGRKFGR